MKKIIVVLFAVLAVVLSSGGAYAVQVTVDGQPVAFDQPPIMSNGRVLVPLRGVFEALGASVRYNNGTIIANNGTSQVQLTIGSTQAMVNGQSRTLDSPPITMGGRTLVPLRFVSEALGADVHWDDASQIASITRAGGSAGIAPPPPVTNQPPPTHHGRIIQSVTLNTAGPLRVGHDLRVTLYGEPGGTATFDIARHDGIPMVEGPAGTYKGTYTVHANDHDSSALVTAHLTLPDGQASAMNATTQVALEGETPLNGGRENNLPPQITNVIHNGHQQMRMKDTLQVTATGTRGCIATFDVGSHRDLAMTEVSPGQYVGRFTIGLGDVEPNAEVLVHLRSQSGLRADKAAPPSVSIMGVP